MRTPEDLTGVIACHINKAPTSIDTLSAEDEILFRKFLPRFNTYHKQFFFSDNQIFVEGYTDQQMFTWLLSFMENDINIVGTGIIDVGGKDELGVFCKICQLIGTNSRFITDLDSLFSGKLRDVVSNDERVNMWLEKQYDKQISFYKKIFSKKEMMQKINLEKLIAMLEKFLVLIGNDIENYLNYNSVTDELSFFASKIKQLDSKYENAKNVDTYKTVIMQVINQQENEISQILTDVTRKKLPLVKNLFSLILAACEAARVYILPKGCIEHYYTQSTVKYMPVSAKDKLFRMELDFIQDAHKKSIRKNYAPLISILEKATSL